MAAAAVDARFSLASLLPASLQGQGARVPRLVGGGNVVAPHAVGTSGGGAASVASAALTTTSTTCVTSRPARYRWALLQSLPAVFHKDFSLDMRVNAIDLKLGLYKTNTSNSTPVRWTQQLHDSLTLHLQLWSVLHDEHVHEKEMEVYDHLAGPGKGGWLKLQQNSLVLRRDEQTLNAFVHVRYRLEMLSKNHAGKQLYVKLIATLKIDHHAESSSSSSTDAGAATDADSVPVTVAPLGSDSSAVASGEGYEVFTFTTPPVEIRSKLPRPTINNKRRRAPATAEANASSASSASSGAANGAAGGRGGLTVPVAVPTAAGAAAAPLQQSDALALWDEEKATRLPTPESPLFLPHDHGGLLDLSFDGPLLPMFPLFDSHEPLPSGHDNGTAAATVPFDPAAAVDSPWDELDLASMIVPLSSLKDRPWQRPMSLLGPDTSVPALSSSLPARPEYIKMEASDDADAGIPLPPPPSPLVRFATSGSGSGGTEGRQRKPPVPRKRVPNGKRASGSASGPNGLSGGRSRSVDLTPMHLKLDTMLQRVESICALLTADCVEPPELSLPLLTATTMVTRARPIPTGTGRVAAAADALTIPDRPIGRLLPPMLPQSTGDEPFSDDLMALRTTLPSTEEEWNPLAPWPPTENEEAPTSSADTVDIDNPFDLNVDLVYR